MNNDKKVCYCRNVTMGDIVKAIEEGATTFAEVQSATRVGQGCGKCISRAENIVNEIVDSKN